MFKRDLPTIPAMLILAVTSVIVCGCASLIVSKGLAERRTPAGIENQKQKNRARWEALVPGIFSWEDSLMAAGAMKDTFIVEDGVRLHSIYVPAASESRRTAIVVHGYLAGPDNVMMLVRMYRDSLNFNVLAPSLRHHGYSGGDHVQLGWDDRTDLLRWSEFAHELFRDTLQVFHGVSMGAATVMMASGEQTPEYVRGFIEDCGYTTAWDEIVFAFAKYLHRDSLFAARAEQKSIEMFGMNLHGISSPDQLCKCSKPMLFIHGSEDGLVPVSMAFENYEAKKNGYRELWIAPGSAHSRSYPDHPSEYTSRVRKFLKEQVFVQDRR